MYGETENPDAAIEGAFASIVEAEFSYLEDFLDLDYVAMETVRKLESNGYTKEDIIAMYGLERGHGDEI